MAVVSVATLLHVRRFGWGRRILRQRRGHRRRRRLRCGRVRGRRGAPARRRRRAGHGHRTE
ncbi:MAG TPA: hypothetical protein DEF51_47700 [Myxococcales bacterium]|nr:hypothetical protein [Myxococcales bacterium]